MFEPRPLWMRYAACRGIDPAVFYSGRGDQSATYMAKRICAACPARKGCYEYAQTQPLERFGIWGGTAPKARRMARRAAERQEATRERHDHDRTDDDDGDRAGDIPRGGGARVA